LLMLGAESGEPIEFGVARHKLVSDPTSVIR
jgi:hypothetical protein